MSIKNPMAPVLFCFTVIIFSCQQPVRNGSEGVYTPDSKVLYDSIVNLDNVFFTAYNNCDLEKMASIISEDIEFYHDKGGLMTSRDSIMMATEKNICGKVTRELVKGSIEVYPIAGYGAVQIGEHFFINNQEPRPEHPAIGKFVHTWKKENDTWKLTRVISLH